MKGEGQGEAVRLWQTQDTPVDADVLAFTVGRDPELDLQLVPYDAMASVAHATMLQRIGVLSPQELQQLSGALREVYAQARAGAFVIDAGQEDGHTALEAHLTQRCGAAGEKIHTGRSRNDQVIAALRLCVRERLLEIGQHVCTLIDALLRRAGEERHTPMAGYTHTRRAMPTTVGHTFAAVAEGLLADLEGMAPALRLANRSPLGAASGYGVGLPLDRQLVSDLLGFERPDINTLHVQNSRGKLEAAALFALHQLSVTLGRFAADVIDLSSEALGCFVLPTPLTTGSSIMPQKRNPDVLELVRGTSAGVLAAYVAVSGVLHGLGQGYHRDLQLTKAPLLDSLSSAARSARIMQIVARDMAVDAARCAAQLDAEIFATDRVYAEVRRGEPFRRAYKAVKGAAPAAMDAREVLAQRNHLGAPGDDFEGRLRPLLHGLIAQWAPFAEGAARARELVGDTISHAT